MAETYGNFELLERIATGGMAEIFRARQLGVEGFEKELVIKRILPHLATEPQFIRMFLDEARIAARLSHPNIAQIYNLGAQGGTYFIAMEYIDGRDLRAVWKLCEAIETPMPAQHAVRIIAECAAALHHAHRKTNKQGKPLGIVHRDVSPQNILITRSGDVKVVDFGIAKAADSSNHTRAGVLKGKFAYMAPEQAAGGRIDRRIDIFALGVVLHELLTGERLFKRDTDVSTLTAVGQCRVAPPSDTVEGITEDLDAIVLKALAKNPKDRYQDAEALQLALEGWLLEKSLPSNATTLASFVNGLAAEVERKSAERPRRSASRSNSKKPKLYDDDEQSQTKLIREGSGEISKPPPPVAPPLPASRRRTETAVAPMPQKSKAGLGLMAFLLGVALVAIVGLVGLQLGGRAAVVKVSSVPPGANVFWNGEPLKETTPCTLPPAGAGAYWLEVSLDGYEAYRAKIDVAAHGEREIAVVLKPLDKK